MERKMNFIKIQTPLYPSLTHFKWVAINFDLVQSFVAEESKHNQGIFTLTLSYASGKERYYIIEKDLEYLNDYLRGEGKLHKGY